MDSAIAAQLLSAQGRADGAALQGAAASAAGAGTPAEVRKAARDFEGMFLSEMLKPMFEGLSTDGMFGGGQAEETYRGLLVQEYGKSIAQAGGIGLADEIAREMLKMQEVQS